MTPPRRPDPRSLAQPQPSMGRGRRASDLADAVAETGADPLIRLPDRVVAADATATPAGT